MSPPGACVACLAGHFCLRGVSFHAFLGVSKQKQTQKGEQHVLQLPEVPLHGTFVEIGARRFFKIKDPDVWVTRDGEHLTREEFARVVQNTTTPVIVNPAEVRWYERPVDE